MTRLTISYAYEDTDFALRLNESLRALGLDTVASLPFSPSSHRLEAMSRLSQRTDALLVILSSAYAKIEAYEAEEAFFSEQHKPIIPIVWRYGPISPAAYNSEPVDFFRNNYTKGLHDLYRLLWKLGLPVEAPIDAALTAPISGSPIVRLRDRLDRRIAPVLIALVILWLVLVVGQAWSVLSSEIQQSDEQRDEQFKTVFPLMKTHFTQQTLTAEATFYPTIEPIEPSLSTPPPQ